VLPAALAGLRYSRLAMTHSGRCMLSAPLGLQHSECRSSRLQASVCSGFLRRAQHDHATAECRRRTTQALPRLLAVTSHYRKKPPVKSPWRTKSMIVFSSLGSLFERCVNGKSVCQIGVTQNGRRGDSAICQSRKRDRLSRNRHVGTRAAVAAFAILLTAIGFSGTALSKPLSSGPAHASGGEVSIAQVPPGMTLRFGRRRQIIAATQPHSEADTALRKMAEDAATAHTLPIAYFLRLIRQESGFNPNSVSPAGAQGIAQFTPATAYDRGLRDPFDPAQALPKSAELLNELRDHFGNLGLAAAAYNAGPERVHKWLAGKSQLPEETIDYVRVITGHDAVDWARSNDLAIDLSVDGLRPSSQLRLRLNRVSWEAQLLATLQATSVDGSAIPAAPVSPLKMGEASLCSHCILQSAY
jgi:Transglycosylase SLT domain